MVFMTIGQAAAENTRKVYKWLDSQGNIYYGDQFPDDPNATERQILNASGVAVRHLDNPEDPESAALRREVLRSGNRDLALITSFGSEDELRKTHEESLALLQSSIAITQGNANRLRKHLEQLEALQRDEAASEQPASTGDEALTTAERQVIGRIRSTLAEQEDQVQRLRQRHGRLASEYAQEMRRYLELTSTDPHLKAEP